MHSIDMWKCLSKCLSRQFMDVNPGHLQDYVLCTRGICARALPPLPHFTVYQLPLGLAQGCCPQMDCTQLGSQSRGRRSQLITRRELSPLRKQLLVYSMTQKTNIVMEQSRVEESNANVLAI
jgi:hypothetical protein